MERYVMVDDHIKRKILLLGDGAVGKTSLIRRFVVDKFSDEYITTIGTKVTKKDLRIESPGKAIDLTFMIWDVLGQKGYKGIQESSFQGAKGALLMYDVTRLETAESLQNYWIPHLLVVTNPIPLVVVGNKVDLADSRRQAQEELDDLKEALGVTGFLSSAKTGQNVEAGFLALAKAIIAQSDAKMSRREAVEEATHEFIAVTDPHPGPANFIEGDPFAFGHQSPSESAVLPTLTGRLVDRHQPAEDLQLADGRLLRSDPEARVGDEHVAPGILDAQEHLEAVRGIVLRAQQGECLEAGRDSTETDFTTPDAMAVEASGSEALLRQHP